MPQFEVLDYNFKYQAKIDAPSASIALDRAVSVYGHGVMVENVGASVGDLIKSGKPFQIVDRTRALMHGRAQNSEPFVERRAAPRASR